MKDVEAIRVKAANAVTALADLNATLAASYQYDLSEQREIAELRGKELARLNHANGEQDKELSVLREANHSLARNCAEESNRASALQTELNSVSSKLKIAGEMIERQTKRADENSELFGKTKDELDACKKELDAADVERAKLRIALQSLTERYEILRGENSGLEDINRSFEKRLISYEEDRDDFRQKICAERDLAVDTATREERRANNCERLLVEAKDELVKREAEMRATNDSQGEHIARLMKELAQVKEEFGRKAFAEGHKHDEELAKTKDELDACKEEYTAAKDEIVGLKGAVEAHAREVEELEEACSRLEGKILKYEGGP